MASPNFIFFPSASFIFPFTPSKMLIFVINAVIRFTKCMVISVENAPFIWRVTTPFPLPFCLPRVHFEMILAIFCCCRFLGYSFIFDYICLLLHVICMWRMLILACLLFFTHVCSLFHNRHRGKNLIHRPRPRIVLPLLPR